MQKKESIVDNLATVAQPVPDSDLASRLLSGLSFDYKAFITSIATRIEPISLDDLIGFLLSQEARLEENSISIVLPSANPTSHNSSSSKGRGWFQSGPNRGQIVAADVVGITPMITRIPIDLVLFVKAATNQVTQLYIAITDMIQNLKVPIPLL